MPYPGERNTGGQQFISAPFQSGPMTTGMIQGVWLSDGEDVDWHWVHTPQGSYVNGYTVRSKLLLNEPKVFEMPSEEETEDEGDKELHE